MTNQQRTTDKAGHDAQTLVEALPNGLRKPMTKIQAVDLVRHQLEAVGIGMAQDSVEDHFALTGTFADPVKRPLTLALCITDKGWDLLEALPSDTDFNKTVTGTNSVVELHALTSAIADRHASPAQAHQGLDDYRETIMRKAEELMPSVAIAALHQGLNRTNALTAARGALPGIP